jgi:hypothetical protein
VLAGALTTMMFGKSAGWPVLLLTFVALSVRKLAEFRAARRSLADAVTS